MGTVAGQQEASAGVSHGLCVDQVAGNPVLEQRCNGYASVLKAHGGSSVFLALPSGDSSSPEKVQQDIAAALAAHPGVNGIFTLGAPEAVSAVAAVKQAGKAGKITIGTTDLSNADLQAVQTGDLGFVLDQHNTATRSPAPPTAHISE